MLKDDIVNAPEDTAKKTGYYFNPNITREEFILLTMEDKFNWLYDMAQMGNGTLYNIPPAVVTGDE